MIYSIFPIKDATIYDSSDAKDVNTGIDQILEISKVQTEDLDYNSRSVIQFDISELSQSISDGTITGSYSVDLEMFASEIKESAENYTIYTYPISGSWQQGIGKLIHSPKTTEGVSWRYRNDTQKWSTGSYVGNVTGSSVYVEGGGTWYTGSGYSGSQSFTLLEEDIRMDVTDIFNKWLDGTIENNGLILKLSDSEEQDANNYGVKRFFSMDTHTIYIPKLSIKWDDSSFVTGSLTSLSPTEQMTIYSNNLRQNYKSNSKTRIRINGRKQFEPRTYSTSSAYLTSYYLPETTYYSVKDVVTDEVVIPFDDTYTKVSCDSTSNYIDLWLNGFMVERFYKIVLKVVDGGIEEYYDNNLYFKVVR